VAAVRAHEQAAGYVMIAMPLAYPRLSKSPSTQPSCFQPLDPGVVNASIPIFFVGRNRDGFWIARDAKGEHGGIFLFRSSALAFARRASQPFGCATVFPSERFELDVENQGNPLIGYFKPLLRFLTSTRNGPTGSGA
jgi:hypothetical protein